MDAPVSSSADRRPIILCGLGRVGLEILCLLRRLGESVTVVTLPGRPRPGRLGDDAGIRILEGDACDEFVLARSGIHGAKALIAATDRDLVNVTIALHARKVAPDLPVVVRLFDQDLGLQLRSALGIRQGYSSSALAAPAFVAAARGNKVATAFELGGEHWFVEELAVSAGAATVGRRLREGLPPQAVVIALDRGGQLSLDPAADCVLGEGDRIIALVPQPVVRPRRPSPAQRLALALRAARAFWRSTPRGLRFACYGLLLVVLLSVLVFHVALGLSPVDAYYFVMTTLTTTGYGDINLQTAKPLVKVYGTLVMVSGGALFAVLFSMTTDLLLRTRFADVLAQGMGERHDHVIVAGLGNTGFRVLRQLVHLGEDVVAVENRPDVKFLAAARALAPLVFGDAGAAEILQRAGLAGAKTVIAATNDDLTNLSIALATKQARPECRVVARVFDHALAERMQQTLAIDAVVSVVDAVAPTFVGAALDADVVRGLVVRDHLLLFADRKRAGLAASDPTSRLLLGEGADGRYRPGASTATVDGRVFVLRWIRLTN